MSERGRSKPKGKGEEKKSGSKKSAGKEKGSSGDFDGDTVDNLQGLISKWVSIPFGIVVVLVAGSALNLSRYFLSLKDDLNLSPLDQQFIKWGTLFGFYGGIVSGPLVDLIGTTITFPITAVLSCGGFIGLAFYTESTELQAFGTVVIVGLVIFVSFCCGLAAITSISTITINFSRKVGPTVVAIMIAYYWISPIFDTTIREGYFGDVPLRNNMIATGIIMFIVFMLAAFIMNENEQSPVLKRASNLTDRLGLLIYGAIAGGFCVAVYFSIIIAEAYQIGVFFMVLAILVNFVALGFTIQILLGTIKSADTANAEDEEHPEKRGICSMIFDIRYFCLLFSTFIVIGSGSTYYIESASVANAIGESDLEDKVNKAYWASSVAAILGGGLLAATFNRLINGWWFAAAAAGSSAFGFAMVFLADKYGVFWFYFSAFFVGAGTGGWWVIAPQLILDDAGPRNFESLWGIVLTVNAFGMFAFDKMFELVAEKAEPATPADCSGVGCFMIPYIISGVLCLGAFGLSFVAYANDSSEEKQPIIKQDANKGSANPKEGGKPKEGKAKSKGKSKSKSKPKK